MSSDSWYRQVKWTERNAQLFEDKLKRARKKSEYLRIQAVHLIDSAPEACISLIDRFLAMSDETFRSFGYSTRAKALIALGRTSEAVKAFEAAYENELRYPSVKTGVELDLAMLIAQTPLRDRFDQAIGILQTIDYQQLPFPLERFMFHVAHALIASEQSRDTEAAEYASQALAAASLQKSGFARHASLGLVDQKKWKAVIRTMKQISRSGS